MKNIIFCLFLGVLSITVNAQGVSINNTGALPDPSAMLDITSTNMGVLIPRIALTDTLDNTTIPSPAHSLIIYNTGTSGGLFEGYYYNRGTAATPYWVELVPNPLVHNLNMAGNKIINLATCTDDNDAVNKAYVDALVAGGGGGSGATWPSELSDLSTSTMNFRYALYYCDTLTEGGHTDWFMPSNDELYYLFCFTATAVPNPFAPGETWTRTNGPEYGDFATIELSTSPYSTTRSASDGAAYMHTRCARY